MEILIFRQCECLIIYIMQITGESGSSGIEKNVMVRWEDGFNNFHYSVAILVGCRGFDSVSRFDSSLRTRLSQLFHVWAEFWGRVRPSIDAYLLLSFGFVGFDKQTLFGRSWSAGGGSRVSIHVDGHGSSIVAGGIERPTLSWSVNQHTSIVDLFAHCTICTTKECFDQVTGGIVTLDIQTL